MTKTQTKKASTKNMERPASDKDNAELERLRRDVPLFHVLYAIEEKANEIEEIGSLPDGIIPRRVLEGFGSWAALFILRELAACGDAKAQQWANDLKRSRDNYRRKEQP